MRRVCLAWLVSVLSVIPAAAQSNVEVNAGVQFDFLSPGARSLAMGGAFIGMADDATAAFVNPAGLRALSRREVSFEGRGRDFRIPVAVRGRASGAPTGIGFDTIRELIIEDQTQSSTGLSFLSFVYPQSRWAIAGYRHELANLDASVTTDGIFFQRPNATASSRRREIRGSMDLAIATYGASGSFNVTPSVSVGAGIAFHTFKMDSRTDRFSLSADFFAPPNFSREQLANYQIQKGDDSDIGVNLGLIWAPNRAFQLGAVYRQGPDFDLRVANINPSTNQPFEGRDFQGQFHVPHVFGVGASFRPMTNGTVTFDINRVQYSRLAEDFVEIFEEPGSYRVSDATELHAGFEYVFTSRVPFALRGGYWFDPEHALEYFGDTALDGSDQFVFRSRGEDQHHFTVGGGAVFGRFEVNGGADFARRATTLSFSAVVRF